MAVEFCVGQIRDEWQTILEEDEYAKMQKSENRLIRHSPIKEEEEKGSWPSLLVQLSYLRYQIISI